MRSFSEALVNAYRTSDPTGSTRERRRQRIKFLRVTLPDAEGARKLREGWGPVGTTHGTTAPRTSLHSP